MKHLLTITCALLLSLTAMAEDCKIWKTIEFDTPAGFRVTFDQHQMLVGKASGIVLTLAQIDEKSIVEPRITLTIEKVAADNEYSNPTDLQNTDSEQTSIKYGHCTSKKGPAIIGSIHDKINNKLYIAIIAFSDGSTIAAEAMFESFRSIVTE